MSGAKQNAAAIAGGALQVVGQLLGLAATVAEQANRPDIAKPVREILEHFGDELHRVASDEAALAAEGNGRPRPARGDRGHRVRGTA